MSRKGESIQGEAEAEGVIAPNSDSFLLRCFKLRTESSPSLSAVNSRLNRAHL